MAWSAFKMVRRAAVPACAGIALLLVGVIALAFATDLDDPSLTLTDAVFDAPPGAVPTQGYWVTRAEGLGCTGVHFSELGTLMEHFKNRFPDMLIDPQRIVPGWAEPSLQEFMHASREHSQTFLALGWPWRCVCCESTRYNDPNDVMRLEVRGGWVLYERTGPPSGPPVLPVILPLRPIWTGLAADIAVFVALASGASALSQGIRGSIRRRRGCCVRCGYNLSGLPAGIGCPECGAGATGARSSVP